MARFVRLDCGEESISVRVDWGYDGEILLPRFRNGGGNGAAVGLANSGRWPTSSGSRSAFRQGPRRSRADAIQPGQ